MPRKPEVDVTAAIEAAVKDGAARFVVSQFRGQGRYAKVPFCHAETPGTPAAEIAQQAADFLFMTCASRPAMVYAVDPLGRQTHCGNITPPAPAP